MYAQQGSEVVLTRSVSDQKSKYRAGFDD